MHTHLWNNCCSSFKRCCLYVSNLLFKLLSEIITFLFAFSDISKYLKRIAGFYVYVSNTTSKDDGYLCYHDKSTEQNMLFDQHINCTLQGRYVTYYNERKQGANYPFFYSKYAYNELCEVEVYGE